MDAKEIEDVDVSVESTSQCCTKCLEWEQRFTELKSGFERKMGDAKKLEFSNTEDEKKVNPVVNGIQQTEDSVDIAGYVEDDKILELMIENQVLECEKKKAESDVQVWKSKCEELERWVMELEQGSSNGMTGIGREETTAATPVGDTFLNVTPLKEGDCGNRNRSRLDCGSRARTQLLFGEETGSKKIAAAMPAGVIDIDGSDDEAGVLNGEAMKNKVALESTGDLNVSLNLSDRDDVASHKGNAAKSTHKRKRALNRITSDSESDTEDRLPVSRLRSLRTKSTIDATSCSDEDGKPVIRRRLVKLGNSKANRTSKESSPSHLKSMKTDKSTSDEGGSESEGESLDGFIVNDSDISDAENTSKDIYFSASDSELGDDSDSDTNYSNIIARIGRYKDHKWDWNWEFLADMQAAFGKDPELCMRAVCALYRKQTTDEKYHKATILRNGQGFSQCHAFGGSKLGEFLTDGDPEGDLNRSVEELEKYDRRGVEKCRKLALHYSDQLFKSYQSGEDPLWLPSESKRRVIDDDNVKLPSGDRCSTQPSGMSKPSAMTSPNSNYEEETGARQAVVVNDELGQAFELTMTNVRGKKHSSEDLTGSPDQNDEHGITCQNVFAPSSVRKRKRASTVCNSDSESEDNIPIGAWLKKESKMDASSLGDDEDGKPHDVRSSKRRLTRLRNLNKGLSKENSPSGEDDESETEGESLDDFIDDSDV